MLGRVEIGELSQFGNAGPCEIDLERSLRAQGVGEFAPLGEEKAASLPLAGEILLKNHPRRRRIRSERNRRAALRCHGIAVDIAFDSRDNARGLDFERTPPAYTSPSNTL
jgi:hypothetical protein